MKLAFVYFTYSHDQDMLQYSIRSINMLKSQYDIDIFIIDDANMPMSFIPENVIYIKTSFNRNRNLNGKECLIGMIQEYEKIFQYCDYDWCIKIDSDVYVNHLDWLNDIPQNHSICQIGVQSELRKNIHNEPQVCYGCFHGFNATGLYNLKKNIKNLQYYLDTSTEYDKHRIAEDYFSCRMICEDNCSANFYLVDNFKGMLLYTNTNINKMYFDFKFEDNCNLFINNMPNRFMHNFFAITFKAISKRCNSDYKRNYAQYRMQRYVEEFIERNKKI